MFEGVLFTGCAQPSAICREGDADNLGYGERDTGVSHTRLHEGSVRFLGLVALLSQGGMASDPQYDLITNQLIYSFNVPEPVSLSRKCISEAEVLHRCGTISVSGAGNPIVASTSRSATSFPLRCSPSPCPGRPRSHVLGLASGAILRQ